VVGDDVVEAIGHDTLHTVPEDGSACWSTRSMAARYGIGKDTVARIWQARRIRPWKAETFKLSTDPSFESKLRDVVGL
jgi:DNA-binding transcriptional MocR family regulator